MLKFLYSLKLAIILIALLTIIFIISSIYPWILNTPLFIIPLIIFTLNLILCTIRRLVREIKGVIRFAIGPDLIHLGIIALIFAGFISLFGNRETTKLLGKGDSLQYKNYSIIIDDFNYYEYKSGRPKDWITTLSIYSNKLIKTRNIEVGKPLRFRGLTIYQVSYTEEKTGLQFKVDHSYYLKLGSFLLIFTGVFITYFTKLKESK